MRVIQPETFGFCKGVRYAIGKAEEALITAVNLSLPCYIYGDIVHSKAVMENLRNRGMIRIGSPDEASERGVVVIRAHGISDRERAIFIKAGHLIVDATCPVVLRSQSLLRSSANPVVVIGKAGHSEVDSLLGACNGAILIENSNDLDCLSRDTPYDAVVQTTFSLSVLDEILMRAAEKSVILNLLNTICRASKERREALLRIKDDVDVIIVAGDRESKNTAELWKTGLETGLPSYLVSSPDEIPQSVFAYDAVGLTAGASCPDTLIDRIKRRLEDA